MKLDFFKHDPSINKFVEKEPGDDIAEFRLKILSYSCHCEARRQLDALFSDSDGPFSLDGIRTYCFYEYFCEKPIKKGNDVVNVYVPFVERIIRDHPYIIKHDGVSLKVDSFKRVPNLKKAWPDEVFEPIRYKDITITEFCKKAVDTWNSGKDFSLMLNDDMKIKDYLDGEIYNKEKFLTLVERIDQSPDDDNKVNMLKEFRLAGHQFWREAVCGDSEYSILYVSVPISTENFFYGHIIAGFPLNSRNLSDDTNTAKEKRKDVWKKRVNLVQKIHEICKDLYLPVLALFFNSDDESIFRKKMKPCEKVLNQDNLYSTTSDFENIVVGQLTEMENFLNGAVYTGVIDNESEIIERNLHRQWNFRKTLLEDLKNFIQENHFKQLMNGDVFDADKLSELKNKLKYTTKEVGNIKSKAKKEHDGKYTLSTVDQNELWPKICHARVDNTLKYLKQSLIFSKFMVGSPRMVKIIKDIMDINLDKGEEDELPSCLVIGEPGSGKDKIARLIPQFSKDFHNADYITINMASLKPQEIASPLISGVNLLRDDNSNFFHFDGIFDIASNDTKFNFILDELNSLDIDSQGVLLRIIENGELQQLGSSKTKKINASIIGVMNELPNQLTMEKALDELKKSRRIFGELPFIFVDESLRRMRRLRADIHYRMRRGGEIRLPSLNERKEDIPILFYFFLEREIKKKFRDIKQSDIVTFENQVELEIETEALDELINPNIIWSGGIRTLQYLTKKILKRSINEFKIVINKQNVKEVLDNELRRND